MTAEEFELLTVEEAEAMPAERYPCLRAAGYGPTSALMAAMRVEVDIEMAEELMCDSPPGFSTCMMF